MSGNVFKKLISICMLVSFMTTSVPFSFAQSIMALPVPGTMVSLSQPFNAPTLKGVKVYADKPLRFDFILDKGDMVEVDTDLKEESKRLIRYFLASLTIPQKDLWVNLSPYEKDRIAPEAFGQTEMGRDLLAQDYVLKQITASVIYPESDVGKKFWTEIYQKIQDQFGTTDIPVDTFNKVWIVPEKAIVYENAAVGTAYVVESKLKVMLESDYLAIDQASIVTDRPKEQDKDRISDSVNSVLNPEKLETEAQNKNKTFIIQEFGKQVIREIVIPVLEKEVNEGRNFAKLRQVYQSLILATWYKKKIKKSLLAQLYVDQHKVDGVNIDDPKESEKIWEKYVDAFKKGVFNFIQEEQDGQTQEILPRRYFSGGVDCAMFGDTTDKALVITNDKAMLPQRSDSPTMIIKMKADLVDMAMSTGSKNAKEEIPQGYDFVSGQKQNLFWKANGLVYVILDQLLVDESWEVRAVGIQQIEDLTKAHPELMNEVFRGALVEKFSDKNRIVREEVTSTILGLARMRPELINKDFIDALKEKLFEGDEDVREAIVNMLGELAEKLPELMNEDFRDTLIWKLSDNESNVSQAAVKAIGELAKTRPELMNEGLRDALILKLSDRHGNVSQAAVQAIGELAKAWPELMNENILDALMERFSDENSYIRLLTANTIGELANARPELINKNFLNALKRKLLNENENVREEVLNTIAKLTEVRPEIMNEDFKDILVSQLTDKYPNVRQTAVKAIGVLTKARPELMNEDIMDALMRKLADENGIVCHLAATTIRELMKKQPELMNQGFMTVFIGEMSSNINENVREVLINTFGELAKVRPALLDKDILDALVGRLSDGDDNVRYVVAKAIGELAKARSELINKDFIKALIEKLSKGHHYVLEAAAHTIGELAKSRPELMNTDISGALMDKLLKGDDGYLRKAVANAIGELAKTRPDLIHEDIMKALVSGLLDSEYFVRKTVVKAIGELVKVRPDLMNKGVMTVLKSKLTDNDRSVCHVTANMIEELIKSRPEVITKDFRDMFAEELLNVDINVREAMVNMIKELAQARPDLINKDFIGVLVKQLENGVQNVREAVANAIRILAKVRPELVSHDIVDAFVGKFTAGDSYVCYKAVNSIGALLKVLPELMNKNVMKALETILTKNEYESFVRQETVKTIGELAQARPDLINESVMAVVARKLTDKDRSVRHIVANLIEVLMKLRSELITKDLRDMLVDELLNKDEDVGEAVANIIGELAKARPDLMNKDIVKTLVRKLSGKDNNVCQAAANAIGELAKARPDLMNEGVRNTLMKKLSDKDKNVRIKVANAIKHLLINQQYNAEVHKKMIGFVRDQHEGLGLSKQKINEGLNFLYAFAHENPEALGSFLTVIQELGQKKKETLIHIGYSYFKMKKFKDFIEILVSQGWVDDYDSLIEALEAKFIEILGLKKEIEGRVLGGWAGIERFVILASYGSIIKEKIINKIVITLRLMRQGVGKDTGFRSANDIESSFPKLRKSLICLLEDQNIPLYDKRRLLQSFPLGDIEDISLLRERAIRLVNAATGLIDSLEGLVGKIRNRIHNNPSSQDLLVVEAYKIFVETNGRDGRSRLEELGYNDISTADHISTLRKDQTLQACDDLLTSLRQVYGGGSLENIRQSLDDLGDVLDTEQQQKLSENSTKIDSLLKQEYYDLKHLRTIVEIRQQINDVIRHANGEILYQALKLDLRLEILVYRIFTSIDDKIKDSPEGLLLTLKNSRLNGYGEVVLDHLTQELEGIIKQNASHDKDMRLYTIVRRSERMIKNILNESVQSYHVMAQKTGAALEIIKDDQIWVENFASNIFRGDSLYLLSLLTNRLKRQIKDELGLSGWQVVVPGTMSGKLHYMNSLDRLNEVKENEILVIDQLPSDSPVLSRVAGIIVFEEDSLMSHPAIRARQNGTPYVVCPNKDLVRKYYDQRMTITVRGDTVDLRESGSSDDLIAQKEISKIQVPSANLNSEVILLSQNYSPNTTGQKAYNLNEVYHIPLADGQRKAEHLTLSFAFYQQILQDPFNQKQRSDMNGLIKALETADISDEEKARNVAMMHDTIETLRIPEDILRQTRAFIRQKIPQGLIYLRSSTNAEDLSGYAGAGLYDSFGAVDPDNLKQLEIYIKKVWASVWNERAYADRERNGIDHSSVHMAVLVHEMVNSTYSYVLHTVNPSNRDSNEMMIEIVQGLGEALVSGSIEYQGAPHRFVYNKNNGKIKRVSYADKDLKLIIKNGRLLKESTDYSNDIFVNDNEGTIDLLSSLFKHAKKVEAIFSGEYQDIEGCLVKEDATGRIKSVFVQSRNQQGISDSSMLVDHMVMDNFKLSETISTEHKPDMTGGIDLNFDKMNLQVQNSVDPVMIRQLQNVSGLTPVIIGIEPMTSSVSMFLENTF